MLLDYVQQTIGRILRSACLSAAIIMAAALTTNTAHAQFTDIGAGLTGVHHGPSLWGDDDNDGDLDLFINGQHTLTSLFGDVHRNAPIGTFTAAGTGLPLTYIGTGLTGQAWGDYDNDGNLDLYISGSGFTGPVSQVYKNVAGVYSLAATLTDQYYSAQWGDYDNDGDLDLLCGGGSYHTVIYRNDGTGFTDIGVPFVNGQRGSAAWGDYDNDGDLDVIVTGHIPNLQAPKTRLYRNDGGAFVYVSTATFQGVGTSAVAWGDYDNDGDLDIALSGIGTAVAIPGETRHLMVYRNNGTGTFSPAWTAPVGLAKGSLAWGDYNNDGSLDLLVTGEEFTLGIYTPTARVYKGNGGGVFTDISAGLTGVDEGRASWGDYDNDGRLDILLAGEDAGGTSIAKVYHNTGVYAANTAPGTPTGLSVLTTAHSIKASWAPPADAETPSTTLSYNIYIRSSTGVYSPAPMADVSSGWRRVPELGNAQLVTSRTIGGLTPGATYDVCVQAIDQAYAGSAFACTTSVTLPSNESDVMIHDCIGDVGAEPNLACGGCYWNSSDIYIRNTNDGLINTTDQTPISGASNWVYVKLKNLSATTSSTGRVYVYFAKASAGLAWQTNWVNDVRSGVVYGNIVGYYDVTLPPSGSTTAEVEWTTVPDPSDFGDPDAHHFCLLARYVSWDDPMTFPEVTNQITNTRENNNIAWRNVTVVDGDGPLAAPLDIHNIRAFGVIGRIDFNVPQEEAQNSVLDHGTVTVDLGADLYQRWLDGGAVGVGVRKASQEQGNTEIVVESTNASIQNLSFQDEETFTVRVKIALSADDPGPPGTVYHWDVVQYDDVETDPVGGERYEIHAPGNAGGEGAGKKGVTGTSALAQALRLTASPNPTNGSTRIAYTLPSESAVTVSIFDASGRLVRTLVENEAQAAGNHATTWDGTGRDGRRVPTGTYFYRVHTANGSAEAQIKIVR